ncbi:MAG: TRAP transporter large permease [Dehalococcoidales bacterium]|nr:TRAP transporter large permease [Dehalococcoidales bacterium]
MELSPLTIGIIGFLFLFTLIFLGMPIAFAFGFTGFLGLWYMTSIQAALGSIPVIIYNGISSYTLTAIPLFVLMGMFANVSSIGPDLYSAALKWFGKLPGGLALTTVWGTCAFGAVTGSSTAGVLTFTPIAYDAMVDLKYDKRLAAGAIMAGATMGTIIPPSMSFIIYGVITTTSIGRLFISGIIPGLLQATMYTILIICLAGFNIWPGPHGPSSTLREKISSLKNVWGMLLVFAVVIGGLYMGIFTPTEAAAVGAFVTFIILISRKGFHIPSIRKATEDALANSSMILLIIVASLIFSNFIALSGLSRAIGDSIANLNASPAMIMAVIIMVFFIAGCLIPATPMMLLFIPLTFPIVCGPLGYDPILYGVIVTITVEIAVITPPVGVNLFAFKSMRKEAEISMLFQANWPFVVMDLIRVAIIVAVPALSLWLPNMMMGVPKII